ncbi:MAG: hypothetical protein KJ601_06500 [Nanoarchaeota archaeon]|nr:hypothetical protein [Nanoarchaeota archaeon]
MLIIVVLIVNSFALYTYYSKPTKVEWNKAANYIEGGENQTILFSGSSIPSTLIFDYYYHYDYRRTDLSQDPKGLDIISLNQSQVWLVLYKSKTRNWHELNSYKERLDACCELTDYKDFFEVRVYRYEVKFK